MATFRETSREEFVSSKTVDHINVGSLQRIADATEKMAANYTALQNDRDYYKRRFEEYQSKHSHLIRRISALQGVITKMKKK